MAADYWDQRLIDAGLMAAPPVAPPPPTPNGNGNGHSSDPGDARRYGLVALRREADALTCCPEGQRNDTLNRAAFNLAGLVDAGALSEEEVDDTLTGAARAAGLDDTEIRATLASGRRGSKAKVGARTIPAPTTPTAAVVLAARTDAPNAPDVAPTFDVAALERGFWDTRASLTSIRDAALARMTAPWAVLAHCAARALTLTSPRVTLPPIIGGPGSLNWFAAITAISGGGKGAASAAARVLVPLGGVPIRNLGSGEGMITAYQVKADDDWPGGLRESVMFLGDEIDTIAALGARTGSTTMAVLRSGFSGETLGFSYATKGRDIHLDAGTYRMTLVLSVQPRRAGALLDDHRGGTPQRFMWFPGMDRRVTATAAVAYDGARLPLPDHFEMARGREIVVPNIARDTIVANRVKAMHGDADVLDGHALFCREKFAYALALLDGRMSMSAEDWELSGIATAVSDRTRAYVLGQMSDAAAEDASERGRLMGISSMASDEEKARVARERHGRVARWVLDKLGDAGDAGLAKRDLLHGMAGRDRAWLDAVLVNLVDSEFAVRDEAGRWRKR